MIINIKNVLMYFSIFLIIGLFPGCIKLDDNRYFNRINVDYFDNEDTLHISDQNYSNNDKIFSLLVYFEKGDSNILLEFYNNNNIVIIKKISTMMDIRYVEPFKNYTFHFEIKDEKNNWNTTIIGLNNQFIGSLFFNENRIIRWNIDEKYNDIYRISNSYDNLLIIKLFPSLYDYNLYFSFSIIR